MKMYDNNEVVSELLKRKKKLKKKLKLNRRAQKITVAGLISLPCLTAAGLTLGSLKVLDYNPFKLEDNKVYEECRTDEAYQDGGIYTTYEYYDHNSYLDKDNYDDSVDITFRTYSEWSYVNDHYERTVSRYNATKTIKDKEYIENNIDNINLDDIASWNFEKIDSYQLEGYNLTPEELAAPAYMRVTSSYIDGLTVKGETIEENTKEIFAAALTCSFLSTVGLFGLCMIDTALYMKHKSLLDLLQRKRKRLLKEYKDTKSKINFVLDEENDINENTIVR